MAEGCCDLLWHPMLGQRHRGPPLGQGRGGGGLGQYHEVPMVPMSFTGNSRVSSLVGGGELWGGPGPHIPPQACGISPCSKITQTLCPGLPPPSPPPAPSPPACPRARTRSSKPVSISEKTTPLPSSVQGSHKLLEKPQLERFSTQTHSRALPARVQLMPRPYLHHLLANVDDAEPMQELGEALQLGVALLQGHLPLAGQLPAEVLDQLALEEKAKARWDPPAMNPPTHPTAAGGHGRR